METNQIPHPKQTKWERLPSIYQPACEVRNLDQKMVLLNSQPVHSSTQHRKVDPRETPQDILAQGKENTGRKKNSLLIPSSASA